MAETLNINDQIVKVVKRIGVEMRGVKTTAESKVSPSDLNTALAAKVDTEAMNTALAAKVDTTAMNTALKAKADKTALTTKADASTVTTLQGKVDEISGKITVLTGEDYETHSVTEFNKTTGA